MLLPSSTHRAVGDLDPDRARVESLFRAGLDANYRRISRVFLALMVAQWAFAIAVALLWSPYSWAGRVRVVHLHVYAAVFLAARSPACRST